VNYKSPRTLLSEFTRSVGRGAVTIESRKTVPLGTQFIFELIADGVEHPIEVFGEVLRVTPGLHGKHLLHIRYDPATDRKGIDLLIQRIFDAHRYEKVRKHPRLPLNLRGTENAPYSPQYLVRDISLGGVGVEVEADKLPNHIQIGEPFLLDVTLSIGTLMLYGEILWTFTPPIERAKLLNPAFGVQFGKLRADTVDRLEEIIRLKGLPPPPWKARLTFGMEAVSRMP
jgi:hypothetical protein